MELQVGTKEPRDCIIYEEREREKGALRRRAPFLIYTIPRFLLDNREAEE